MRKIQTINRAEQSMLLQALESLIDDYRYRIEISKDEGEVERTEFLKVKAISLYEKLDDREITDVRIEEVLQQKRNE